VRGACARLLEEESFRTSARRIRDELDSMPHPADLVPMIEELAATAGARSIASASGFGVTTTSAYGVRSSSAADHG
jgi:hypothetical protein